MDATQPEIWKPIPGWEGLYDVSDRGRVFSRRTGKFLKAGMNRRHRHVALAQGDGGRSYRVHRLVLAAFVGPMPEGMEVRHLDDDPNNNSLSNLAYGTRSENMSDRVRLGTHHNSRKTHCKWGHEFTPENTLPNSGGKGRRCRTCKRKGGRSYMRNKRRAR